MVLNATFNNISFMSWRSVLFVEYTSPKQNSNSHHQLLIASVIINPTTIRSRPRQPLELSKENFINMYDKYIVLILSMHSMMFYRQIFLNSANIQIGICVGILFRYISRFLLNSQNTYKAMQLDAHYHLIEICTATS